MTDLTCKHDLRAGDTRTEVRWSARVRRPDGTVRDVDGPPITDDTLSAGIGSWWSVADHPHRFVPDGTVRLVMGPLLHQRHDVARKYDERSDKTRTVCRWLDVHHDDDYDPDQFRTTGHWRDHVVFDHDDPRDHIDTRWPQHALGPR